MKNMDKNKQEEIKGEIKKLIEKINNKDTSKEERLDSLKILNALLELNINFIREIKKEIKNQ